MEESIKIDTQSERDLQRSQQDPNLIMSLAYRQQKQIEEADEFVFKDLNDINPITLLKKPNSFRQCFDFLYKMAGQQLANQNYEISLKFYEKTIELVEIGKNIINKQNAEEIEYIKITMFANMACGYLNTRKLQKCSKYCQKAIDQIQKYLTTASKQIFLKLSMIQMVLKFQHCAILSQLEQHQRSLQLCKSNLVLIKKYLEILDIFVRQSLKSSYEKKKSNQMVQFSRQVLKFAASIIKQLLDYIEEPMLKKQQMVFYYWQKNPQKNQQQLLKRFIPLTSENCKRSILGVSKKAHWFDQFNIGSVMHMTPLVISDLKSMYPVQQYLFKDKLYEITIYCSMCYFTMATQTRFIDANMKALSNNQSQNPNSSIKQNIESSHKKIELGNLTIMKKYGYFEKSQMFKRSEVFHLCSIDVMSRIVKHAIPYINHIVKSYEKHYIKQKKLDQIMAIFEESVLEQDTMINQSIAEYMPNDHKGSQRSILKLDHNQFSKHVKNNHFYESQNQIKIFEEILQKKQTNKNQNRREKQQFFKGNSEEQGSSNTESLNQNSGEYLQSVVKKKKKSLTSSRSKEGKPLHQRNNPLQDQKQIKTMKKRLNGQKSPIINGFAPPKPIQKKKKV